jgi:hypothetical protein
MKAQEFRMLKMRRSSLRASSDRPLSLVVFMVLSLLALLLTAERALTWVLLESGLEPVHGELIVGDNELPIQLLGLHVSLAAWFLLVLRKGWRSYFDFLKPQGLSKFSYSQAVMESARGWGRGVIWTSLLIAVLVFFGVLKIETPQGVSSFAVTALGFLKQAGLIFLWVFGIQKMREMIWPALESLSQGPRVAWVVWVLFETHLYFRFLSGGLWFEFLPHAIPLMMLSVLSTGLFVMGRDRPWGWNWRIVSATAAGWTSVVAIYGFPLGASRLNSLFYVFPGPGLDWPMISWEGLAPLSLVVVMMACANILLIWGSKELR